MDKLFLFNLVDKLCDYIYPYNNSHEFFIPSKMDLVKNIYNIRPYSYIFVNSNELLNIEILLKIQVPFILITCGNDNTIPYNSLRDNFKGGYKLLAHPYLVKWYSTNIDKNIPSGINMAEIADSAENFHKMMSKLEYIPIGLSIVKQMIIRDNGCEYMSAYKNNQLQNLSRYYAGSPINNFSNLSASGGNTKKNLLYVKCTVLNDRSNMVMHKFENLRDKYIEYLEPRFNINNTLVSFDDYIEELKTHKFCLSLPGRGLDCHRTWECLTLGVIPIVLESNLCPLYENLPVVVINRPEDVTIDFLETKYREIMSKLDTYSWDKLEINYWIKKCSEYKSAAYQKQKLAVIIMDDNYVDFSRFENLQYKCHVYYLNSASGNRGDANELEEISGLSTLLNKIYHDYDKILITCNNSYRKISFVPPEAETISMNNSYVASRGRSNIESFKFYRNMDIMGHDLRLEYGPISHLLHQAIKEKEIKAFNTKGYMKTSVGTIVHNSFIDNGGLFVKCNQSEGISKINIDISYLHIVDYISKYINYASNESLNASYHLNRIFQSFNIVF